MAIRDIFKMIKADRYTQDGREELIKAQEAVTEDVTYKPGDISRKTGLQKQPDGSWAPVKNAPAQKKTDSKSGSAQSASSDWKSDLVSKLDTEKLKQMNNDFKEFEKSGRNISPEAKERNDLVKAELAKRKGSASGSGDNPYVMSEAEKKEAMKDPRTNLSQKYDAVKNAKKGTPEYEKALNDYTEAREEFKTSQGADAVKEFPIMPESGSAPSMTSEQRKKWEAKASNPSETKASLTNFINSMKNSESFKKANPHAQEIIDIYKTELKKREDNANYRPEKVYSDAPSELKIQGMSKEEYIPWRMKTYKENEAQASSMWNHFAEQQKNKGKENEYDPDFHPLRDSAPRILTGDCKVRIKKSK